MKIQFFKGPKDGITLDVPDRTEHYVCHLPLEKPAIYCPEKLNYSTEKVYYYVDFNPRPLGNF